jgi:hypothetical protein
MKPLISRLLMLIGILGLASAILPVQDWLSVALQQQSGSDLSSLDVYHDVVQPILERRCSTCHNASKRNGSLEMSSPGHLRRGGDSGPAIDPGNASISLLIDRVTLPRDDEAFMPAEGRTPLSAAQIAVLSWWIDAGAPEQALIASLTPDAGIMTQLAQVLLELTSAESEALPPAVEEVAAEVKQALYEAGFLLRTVAQNDDGLIIASYSPGQVLSTQQLAILNGLGQRIVELDLRAAGLQDEHLITLPDMPALSTLKLASNRLGDAGVASLTRFQGLRHLNLSGNPGITDQALVSLQSLPALEKLYLWNTGVSATAGASLHENRSGLMVDLGAAWPGSVSDR